MNGLDIGVVLIVLVGAVAGFLQGMLRQALALVALYLATVLASQYYTIAGNALGWFIPADAAPRASIGFLIVFFWGLLFLGWLSRRVYPAARILSLGVFDNVGGAALGLVTGAVVVCLFATGIQFAVSVSWPSYDHARVALEEIAANSRLLPFVSAFAPTVYSTITPWFPGGVPAIIAPYS